MAWLTLIRWKNLLIILATQLLAWWCVLLPAEKLYPGALLLDGFYFGCLTISTILIAAAGYIINDYFDVRIDNINRPEKVVIGNRIPGKMAILAHIFFNAIAMFAAGIVAKKAGQPEWLLLQTSCMFLLWFYSTHFKRQFITGNLCVALLTALTIITLMVYEPALPYFAKQHYFLTDNGKTVPNPLWVLGTYAYFAFMLTWIREIVKDMEDFRGDATEGCVTMPIQWGLLRTSRFVQALSLLTIVPLVIAGVKLLGVKWMPLGIYILALIVLPLTIWTWYLPRKASTEHYAIASRWLKFIMVFGIGTLIIYFRQTHG